ncbi:MAG: hypothetical protein L6E13_02415 [Firmicutes bacterium]|nr:hypothetical protein [Bacillota bacterium]
MAENRSGSGGTRETIYPERAPRAAVPVPFFAAALVALVLLEIVMVARAEALVLGWRHNPPVLVAVHLFLLGWGTTLIFGAAYQMAPVVLESSLWRPDWPRLHLGLHGAGVAALVAGFWRWQPLWIASGGTLVLVGAALFALNLAATLRQARKRSPVGLGMAGSALYLLLTVSWGWILALNLRLGFLGLAVDALVQHMVFGLAGWFTLMIVAAAYQLIPMFAVAPPPPTRRVWWVTGGLAAAPAVAVLSLALLPGAAGDRGARLALLAEAGLLAAFVLDVWRMLRRRPRRPMEPPVRFAAAAVAAVALTIGWGLGLLLGLVPGSARMQMAFAALVLLGWIGTMSVGQLYRILPFVVWLHRFRHRRTPTERVPFIHEMAPRGAANWILGLWIPGVALQVLGFGLGHGGVLRLGSLAAAAAVAVFVWVMVGVIRHLRVPPGAPEEPPRPQPQGP